MKFVQLLKKKATHTILFAEPIKRKKIYENIKIIKYLLVGLIMVCITMLISTLTIYLTNKYSLNSYSCGYYG